MKTRDTMTMRKMARAALAIAATGLLSGAAAIGPLAATPATAQEWDVQLPADGGSYPTGDLFISNLDALHTAAGPVLEGVSILIRDGIIEGIGADLAAPEGVRVVDGTGLTAMPGIVDEHSHTALVAGNEGTAPVVPEVRVLDALTTEDFGIYRALSGGVTTARIMHGSSNPIGGQSAVIKMRWGMDATEQLLMPGAPKFVKFALGENVTRKAAPPGANSRFPMSRAGVEAIYVEAFTAAQAYRAEWDRLPREPGCLPRSPAPRSPARGAGRHHGGAHPHPRALVPRGRNPHAHPRRGTVRVQNRRVHARHGGIPGRDRDGGARGRRLDLLRLVAVQARSVRVDPAQRRDHAPARRAHRDQLRHPVAPALHAPRDREAGEVRGRERAGSAPDADPLSCPDDVPGRPGGKPGGRQGRRCRAARRLALRLVQPSREDHRGRHRLL